MPPGRRSISHSVVVNGTGANHFTRCSGVVHASQTSSRGTSTIRSKSRSSSGSGRCLFGIVDTPLPIDVAKVGVELIEPQLPRATLFHHPTFRRLQGRRREPVRPDSSSLLRRHQPAPLQHAKVLRERGQRHAEGLGKVARRSRSRPESLDDGPAGWVRQGMEDEIQLHQILRHMPYFALPLALRSTSATVVARRCSLPATGSSGRESSVTKSGSPSTGTLVKGPPVTLEPSRN